ncbi:MAG: SDR family oxidoreductase [Candidatus Thiodiazotropha sp. (ex Dulcina madagascariensis)]|nr:SDR family oxidoreductase [Candidatus Thiodiazotropha sp. (ex Dulcina madagascariensis)]MCU7926367.1 SDR family oxidoreductase [Candidatus Thiodiazotropha sp. (ex Dulcina madagascariensis)]
MNREKGDSPRKLLVTGASQGIGGAITRRLLNDGHRVLGIGRDFSGWSELPGLESIILDLSDLDSLPTRFDEIIRAHGDLDGVILNAGYGRFGSLEEFSYRQIRDLVNVNLLQHLFIARAVLPHLKRSNRGDIILIGSESALAGGRKGAVYSACKFAIRGFAQSLRAECSGSGIRLCLINPGMVDTGFFDSLDFAPGDAPENHLRPDDIAETVSLVLQAHPGTVFDEINLNPLKKVIQFKKA